MGEALRREDAVRARLRSYRSLVDRTCATLGDLLTQAETPYVALSGGKDSLVAYDIARRVRPGIPAIWCDDELEYDQTPRTVRDIAGDALVLVSGHARHAGWFRPWRDRPWWREPDPAMIWTHARIEDWAPRAGYDAAVTGVRHGESVVRREFAAARGEAYGRANGTLVCQPLIRWSLADVWAYIAECELPYHPVYDILSAADVERDRQRVGPLPLSPRWVLEIVDPTLMSRLEARYGHQWS